MPLTLEEAIARVPMWKNAPDLQAQPLSGGITNHNFKIEVGGETFVLRLAGVNTDLLGIDRVVEYAANRLAGELQIAPEVVYYIEPEGYLVTRFIHGRPLPPEELGRPQMIQQVASTLKVVHSMPPVDGAFSPFRVVESYSEIAKKYGVAFPENFPWLLERLHEAETAFLTDPYHPSMCHNDLLNENFLYDGQMRILDWEYAGMGDIFFDLANFSVNHGLSDEQDRWLLECYFGEVSTRQWARLKIMKILSDFRESMWGLVQCGISELDFDFPGYARKHFDRMTINMHDPRWGQWLQEVAQNV
jgi:thiamine kinase-like enzyme